MKKGQCTRYTEMLLTISKKKKKKIERETLKI